jgi:hypothetical protein
MKMKKYFKKFLRERIVLRKSPMGNVTECLEYGKDENKPVDSKSSCDFPKKFLCDGKFYILESALTRCFESMGFSIFVDVSTFVDEKGVERVLISVEEDGYEY